MGPIENEGEAWDLIGSDWGTEPTNRRPTRPDASADDGAEGYETRGDDKGGRGQKHVRKKGVDSGHVRKRKSKWDDT
jgi:hypothetical protein